MTILRKKMSLNDDVKVRVPFVGALLCVNCEELMQQGEGPFLKSFRVFMKDETLRYDFDQCDWFPFFSASLIWRALMISSDNLLNTSDELLSFLTLQCQLRYYILNEFTSKCPPPDMSFMVDRPRLLTPMNHGFFFHPDQNRFSLDQRGFFQVQCCTWHWFIVTDPSMRSITTRITNRLLIKAANERNSPLLEVQFNQHAALNQRVMDERTQQERSAALIMSAGGEFSADKYIVVSSLPMNRSWRESIEEGICYDFNGVAKPKCGTMAIASEMNAYFLITVFCVD